MKFSLKNIALIKLISENERLRYLYGITKMHKDPIKFRYLESCINNIYPSKMIVNKTNVSVQNTNFLDMTISIYRGKFYIKLYDKRSDYDFDAISFPYLDGNIPKGQS